MVRPGPCYAQSGVLQIDHLVSLSDAWYKGAREWDERGFRQRSAKLLAVGAKAYFDKAFRDAAGWLPPNPESRCEFVARQIAMNQAYELWVSANEKRAMATVLEPC